jgi:predicted aconitase with swiveling domain
VEKLVLIGKPVIAGRVSGIALASHQPLSFWGGYDWKSGEITDRRHPLSGMNAKGKVLAVPYTRGSSTTTAVLLEAIREGTAPAAILTTATDFFFALASVVAGELYEKSFPLIALSDSDFDLLKTGDQIEISENGNLYVSTNHEYLP